MFFSPLHTLNLTLIAGFTVFIFRAGWFQAELLFYFLNFCLFLLFWRLLQRPSLPMALLAGVAAALAYLTKASIVPGLALFAVFAAAQGLWPVLRRRPAPAPISPRFDRGRNGSSPDGVACCNSQFAIRNRLWLSRSSWGSSCSLCLLTSTRACLRPLLL